LKTVLDFIRVDPAYRRRERGRGEGGRMVVVGERKK